MKRETDLITDYSIFNYHTVFKVWLACSFPGDGSLQPVPQTKEEARDDGVFFSCI